MNFLERKIKEMGLRNVTDAAQKMGVPQNSLRIWVRGFGDPSKDSIYRIMKFFNLTPQELVEFISEGQEDEEESYQKAS